ncbi:MAG: Crp/Fnr family transcriptional regulator [Parvibaculum sp.]|jgi:CRP-like cAMP-binding protein|uniref:Crp/Fnr family transcriptional regulator n=1 Tax=Parvibaculum sp. TaxID=2024848 RepID=UPI00283BA5A0|nr:Crp/Fnr family transcriptional regulator [Parvibaculum sp.]MDR3500034.1 Crp/Fnr family transcriptional regulator [Parvibaculum sp.]
MFGTDRHNLTSPDTAQSLRGIRILADLPPREQALLAAECAWRSFSGNEIILSAGQGPRSGDVMFVVRGAVRLARPMGPTGRISYVDVEAGGQFGEMALFGIDESDLTAISREESLLAVMPEHKFVDLLGREESVSRALLCQYARLLRMREASAGAASEGARGATGAQRVYVELLSLAEPRAAAGGSKAGLFIARLPRHRQLADRLSTTEEVVAGAIAELVRLGIAEREYPGLLIGDENALRRLADTQEPA